MEGNEWLCLTGTLGHPQALPVRNASRTSVLEAMKPSTPVGLNRTKCTRWLFCTCSSGPRTFATSCSKEREHLSLIRAWEPGLWSVSVVPVCSMEGFLQPLRRCHFSAVQQPEQWEPPPSTLRFPPLCNLTLTHTSPPFILSSSSLLMPKPKEIRGALSRHSWSHSSSAETYCLQWHLCRGQKVLITSDPWANSYNTLMVRLTPVSYNLHYIHGNQDGASSQIISSSTACYSVPVKGQNVIPHSLTGI